MNILEEANNLVHGERNVSYGHPSIDFKCSADILRALILRRYGVDLEITPDFMGLIMAVAVKGSREAGLHKRDNLVDMAGYAETIQMIMEK